MTFAERVCQFNRELYYEGPLPDGFHIINPFKDNPAVFEPMETFYRKYYSDYEERKLILGINPGRHGAAVTGIPFTDTKRLAQYCDIHIDFAQTHEISSVFVYQVVEAYGGPEAFYRDFYINSPCPLALVKEVKGKWLNCNYYDDARLEKALMPFMTASLKAHISMGIDTSKVYVLGKRNAKMIKLLNDRHHFFNELVVLDHPRYIQQYKSAYTDQYVGTYLNMFENNN